MGTEKQVSVADVINNNHFLEVISRQLMKIEQNRADALKDGEPFDAKLKRAAIDLLTEKGINTTEKYRDAYVEILLKKSMLPSRERNFVNNICYVALIETRNKYF